MINAIRFGNVEIGAYTRRDIKKPVLAIRDLKNNARRAYAYAQFYDEESAAKFMDQLAAAIGIKEVANESDHD